MRGMRPVAMGMWVLRVRGSAHSPLRRSATGGPLRASLMSCAVLAAAFLTACGSARGVGLKRIGSFDSPTYVAGAPGFPKLLFVVEQPGRVEVLRGGHRLSSPFLDISDLVGSGGERGLLSIAFPPDYVKSRRFYVYYTDETG